MKRQVVYLMSGPSFLPQLVVSLATLRQHWQGMVTVYAWKDSIDLVRRIGEDDRLGIQVKERTPFLKAGRKKWQFIDKINLMSTLETDVALYLDADTTVHNPIDEIFSVAFDYSFVSTQFSGWTTKMARIQKRVRKLRGKEGIDQELLEEILNGNFPSPNGGVFACIPTSQILDIWFHWTEKVMDIFIPDETVLHLLQQAYFRCVKVMEEQGKWNCSPKFLPKKLKTEDVVIYHHHGQSSIRPEKSKQSVGMWWPLYEQCLEENVGGMQEWRNQIGNKRMDKMEKDNG